MCNSKGHKVLGVEFSAEAVDQFISENKLQFKKATFKDYSLIEITSPDDVKGSITIYIGDWYLICERMGKVDYIFDRGAYVAVPESVRYAKAISKIVKKGTIMLLMTTSYREGNPIKNVYFDFRFLHITF